MNRIVKSDELNFDKLEQVVNKLPKKAIQLYIILYRIADGDGLFTPEQLMSRYGFKESTLYYSLGKLKDNKLLEYDGAAAQYVLK